MYLILHYTMDVFSRMLLMNQIILKKITHLIY